MDIVCYAVVLLLATCPGLSQCLQKHKLNTLWSHIAYENTFKPQHTVFQRCSQDVKNQNTKSAFDKIPC